MVHHDAVGRAVMFLVIRSLPNSFASMYHDVAGFLCVGLADLIKHEQVVRVAGHHSFQSVARVSPLMDRAATTALANNRRRTNGCRGLPDPRWAEQMQTTTRFADEFQ